MRERRKEEKRNMNHHTRLTDDFTNAREEPQQLWDPVPVDPNRHGAYRRELRGGEREGGREEGKERS